MKDMRFFRHQFVDESEISSSEAEGTAHFKDTYRDGALTKHEKVDANGHTLKTTTFRPYKNAISASQHNENGELENTSYEFPKVSFEPKRVIFDDKGQVVYPITTELKPEKLRVLEARSIGPSTDLYGALSGLEGQEIQLNLPRRRDLYRVDNAELRKALSDRGIKVALVHGPDVDVFHEDFVPCLAWIRGNYGVDTATLHPARGDYTQAMSLFTEKQAEIARFGMDLAYENLDANGRWLSYPGQLAEAELPFLKETLDLSHLDDRTDLIALEERLFEGLRVVHVSNVRGGEKHLPFREGSLHVDDFLRALKADGYKGSVVLEYAPEHRHKIQEDKERVMELLS